MKNCLGKIWNLLLAECVSTALLPSSASADGNEILSEAAELVANIPPGTRLNSAQSRRCCLAVQVLLDEQEISSHGRLPEFLEQVCHSGIRSELERQGIFHLFSSLTSTPPRLLEVISLSIKPKSNRDLPLQSDPVGTSVHCRQKHSKHLSLLVLR